ncbi:hypothetical protein Hanom_Chr00s000004g01606151 [Helianthus anomalus]
MTKLEISDKGVENVYTQKFLYENYIFSANERKVRRVGHPLLPYLSCAPGYGSL